MRQIDLWTTAGSDYFDTTGYYGGRSSEGKGHVITTHRYTSSDPRWVEGPGQMQVEILKEGNTMHVPVDGPLFGMSHGIVPVRYAVDDAFDCRLSGALGQKAVLQELGVSAGLLLVGTLGLWRAVGANGEQGGDCDASQRPC